MDIHLPEWLYERMPYLYSTIGSAVVYWNPNEIAIASGVLLIVAAIGIYRTRRKFRRDLSTLKKSVDVRILSSRQRR